MKKFTPIVLSICLVIFACGEKKTDNNDTNIQKTDLDTVAKSIEQKTTASKKNITDVYFKANGSEPFWSLTISEKMIKLKTVGDSLMTPHTLPEQAQDADIRIIYKLHTELTRMNIQIKQEECISASSGMASPYTVDIEFKKGRATEFTKLEGCGNYSTDYRLHDIWVLEKLNGNEVKKEKFKKDLPTMEINSSENTFSGYAGCNRMNGKLNFEYRKLRFTNIAITKMMCENNLENEFISALKSVTSYKTESNRLWLSNSSGELLVFKKID